MKTCRRGYALLEMLAIIAALVVLMTLSVQPMRTLLSEMPRADRNYQTWFRTQQMLAALRNDVETASMMRLEQTDSEGSVLHLVNSSETVQYRLTDEKTVRTVAPADGTEQTVEEWELPKNRLQVRLWTPQEGSALEVTTWVQRQQGSQTTRNFVQTCVFFRKSQ